MFIAASRFVIANGMEAAVCDAFSRHPHQVDTAHGVRRADELRPIARPGLPLKPGEPPITHLERVAD